MMENPYVVSHSSTTTRWIGHLFDLSPHHSNLGRGPDGVVFPGLLSQHVTQRKSVNSHHAPQKRWE